MGVCHSKRKTKVHVDTQETLPSFSASPIPAFTFSIDNLDPSPSIPKLITPQEACLNICKNSLNLIGFSHSHKEKKSIVGSTNLGFLSVLNFAYTHHYHLQISVSDFIIMIAQGLSQHLKKRSDIIKSELLTPKAAKTIRLKNSTKLFSTKSWLELFELFGKKVSHRYNKAIYEVLVDDSSIATSSTRIATQISLLNQLDETEGINEKITTGLPKITLEGSPEDWEKLRQKVYRLKELNEHDKLLLDWWLKYLIPIVDKLCDQAVTKTPDIEFWKTFYVINRSIGIPYIQGWVNVFIPYVAAHEDLHSNECVDWEGRLGEDYFGITTAQIPSGLSAVAFENDEGGKRTEMLLVSGFLGVKVGKKKNVRAEHFWAIFGA